MMQEVMGGHRASSEVLEFMSELFNAANREGDYCQTLLKLFEKTLRIRTAGVLLGRFERLTHARFIRLREQRVGRTGEQREIARRRSLR